MVQNDDEAWRAIVDNYGDRAELDDPPEPAPGSLETSGSLRGTDPAPEDSVAEWSDRDEPAPASAGTSDGEDEDRFVPPPPPPLPTTSTDRMIAWVGIFGSPVVLLVALVLGIRLPELISYILVTGFVGGFLYLVLKMNREPRDPDDNGAVL